MINLYPSPYTTYDLVNEDLEGLSDGTASLINDQTAILRYIDDASRLLSSACNRVFVPYIHSSLKVAYYKRIGSCVRLPDDCLSLTSVDDYTDTEIISSSYDLLDEVYGYNGLPSVYIDFASSANIFALYDSSNLKAKFTFDGIWGYSQRAYANSWETLTTLAEAIGTTSLATFDVTNGAVFSIGDTLRIGTEFMRVVSIDTDATPDEITVLRGVNGSTTITHSSGASIQRWIIDDEIQMATTRLASWLYQNRKSGSNTLVFGDGTVSINSLPAIIGQVVRNRIKRPMIEVS